MLIYNAAYPFWHATGFIRCMERKTPYSLLFTYDANDHALKFPLIAECEHTEPGIFTVRNIRPESQTEGSLLPPIRLTKKNGDWVFMDNGQTSKLSNCIGRAIEEHP